jgi:nitrous oxidase accessory protein NosD
MDLQARISGQPPGSTLQLLPGEFFGPVKVDKSITIVGRGKSTWVGSRQSPTIRIVAAGVQLQNLMVEVTRDKEGVAVEAAPGTNPVLLDCEIVGSVVGVPAENVRNSETAPEEEPVSIKLPSAATDERGSRGCPSFTFRGRRISASIR